MNRIINAINDAIETKEVRCLPCDKINLDYQRHQEYLDSDEHKATEVFESPVPKTKSTDIKSIDSSVPSILRYFLDGSRRTYKIADLQVRGRFLPLIAGQVGVAVSWCVVQLEKIPIFL